MQTLDIDKFDAACKRMQVDLERVAIAAGMSRKTLYNLREKQTMSIERLVQVARFLEMEWLDLLPDELLPDWVIGKENTHRPYLASSNTAVVSEPAAEYKTKASPSDTEQQLLMNQKAMFAQLVEIKQAIDKATE